MPPRKSAVVRAFPPFRVGKRVRAWGVFRGAGKFPPPVLRYMALSGALVVWDSHPDLLVDVVPGLCDPATYRAVQKRDN